MPIPSWSPLPGADDNTLIAALSESDRRAELRHGQLLGAMNANSTTIRWLAGGLSLGMFVVAIVAMLVVGARNGVEPADVAGGVVPILEALPGVAQSGS